MTYELHPLCTLFPRMGHAEFAALCEDIRINGLIHPIVVVDGMILDGGNRYRACLEVGEEPTFVEFAGDSIVDYVLSANLHRRHMSAGQQAAIVAAAADWSKAAAHGGDRKTDQSATLHLDRAQDRAERAGASVRTQKMADKVAKADPALARKVAHGEVSLPKAVAQVEGKTEQKARKPADVVSLQEVRDERAEVERLTAENEALKEQIAELESMLQEATDELRRADAILHADDRLAEARRQAAEAQESLRLVQERFGDLQIERNNLLREIKALRRKAG